MKIGKACRKVERVVGIQEEKKGRRVQEEHRKEKRQAESGSREEGVKSVDMENGSRVKRGFAVA